MKEPTNKLHQVIDRRLSGKNKSIGNRERFLRRYRDQIKDAVRKAVGDRSIHNIEEGADITLPRRDVSEPVFHHSPGGQSSSSTMPHSSRGTSRCTNHSMVRRLRSAASGSMRTLLIQSQYLSGDYAGAARELTAEIRRQERTLGLARLPIVALTATATAAATSPT